MSKESLAIVLTYMDHDLILQILRTDLILSEDCGLVKGNLASSYEQKAYLWLETLVSAAYKAVE